MFAIDEQVEAVRAEMQATVARLETELSELQQSRAALHQDNTQQLESLERLRRENAELQQRVSVEHVLHLCSACGPWSLSVAQSELGLQDEIVWFILHRFDVLRC